MSIDNKCGFVEWIDERVAFWEIGADRRKSGKCNEINELLESINRIDDTTQWVMCVPEWPWPDFWHDAPISTWKAIKCVENSVSDRNDQLSIVYSYCVQNWALILTLIFTHSLPTFFIPHLTHRLTTKHITLQFLNNPTKHTFQHKTLQTALHSDPTTPPPYNPMTPRQPHALTTTRWHHLQHKPTPPQHQKNVAKKITPTTSQHSTYHPSPQRPLHYIIFYYNTTRQNNSPLTQRLLHGIVKTFKKSWTFHYRNPCVFSTFHATPDHTTYRAHIISTLLHTHGINAGEHCCLSRGDVWIWWFCNILPHLQHTTPDEGVLRARRMNDGHRPVYAPRGSLLSLRSS